MMNYSDCLLAEQFAHATLLTVVQYLHIILSTVALIAIFINVPLCISSKKLNLHRNLKIILINAIIVFSLFALSFLICQIVHQVLYHTYKNPCDILIITWKCLSYRMLINIMIVGFTLIQFALAVERAIATFYPHKYENLNGNLGIIIIIFMWLTMSGWNFYIFYDEEWFVMKPYCILTTPSTNEKIIKEYYVLLSIDLLATLINIYIKLYNKKEQSNRFHKKFAHGSLSRSYQLIENTRTLHVILPLSVAHSLIFIFYLVFAMFVRIYLKPIMDMINFVTIVEASNIVAIIYAILMPAMFFRSRTRFSGTKVTTLANGTLEADVYFENFNKMLEGSYNNQDSRQNRV